MKPRVDACHATHCDQCDHPISVPSDALGQSLVCPACHQTFVIRCIQSFETPAATSRPKPSPSIPQRHETAGSTAQGAAETRRIVRSTPGQRDQAAADRRSRNVPSHPKNAGASAPERATRRNPATVSDPAIDAIPSSEDPPSPKRKARRRFGRFQLERVLGQGGFGAVYLAQDVQLKRRVALKLPRFQHDPQKRDRFLEEATLAAALRHPQIVPVLDAGLSKETPYIASEFIAGQPLDAIHQDRPAPTLWAVEITIKLARAVAYAHRAGIIHRDLKPDNVLIDEDGEPQILDFGLAKRLDGETSRTMDGTVLGTPTYMAPEQARGQIQRLGAASDQYSLGVILYRLLTGRVPHQGPPLLVLKKLAQLDTPSLADAKLDEPLPDDLVAVCDRARAAEMTDRYSDLDAFADDLQRFLDGESVTARPIGRLQRCLRWSRRHPREAILATACGATLLAAFAISFTGYLTARSAAAEAARVEANLRAENARWTEVRKQLSNKVRERQTLRDATAQEKDRTIKEREELLAEIDSLATETARANKSRAKLEQVTLELEKEVARRKHQQDAIAGISASMAMSVVKANELEPEQSVEEKNKFTKEEFARLNDAPDHLLCKTSESTLLLQPGGQVKLTIVSKQSAPKINSVNPAMRRPGPQRPEIEDVSFSPDGTLLGVSNVRQDGRFVIVRILPNRDVQPIALFGETTDQHISYVYDASSVSEQKNRARELMTRGIYQSIGTPVLEESGSILFIASLVYGASKPSLIRHDPKTQINIILGYRSRDAKLIRNLATKRLSVVERDTIYSLSVNAQGEVDFSLQLKLAAPDGSKAGQKATIRKAIPIDETRWLISTEEYLVQQASIYVLDLSKQTYHTIKSRTPLGNRQYQEWGMTPRGELATLDKTYLTTHRFDFP